MSPTELADGQQRDEVFLERSIVEGVVPANSKLSLKELFEAETDFEEDGSPSLVPWIQQRDYLLLGLHSPHKHRSAGLTYPSYVDEIVHALVVLKTPLVEEHVLESILSRLEVSAELYATGISPAAKSNDPRSAPVKEILSEVKIDASKEPVVIASSSQSQGENETEPFLFVLWNVEIALSMCISQ